MSRKYTIIHLGEPSVAKSKTGMTKAQKKNSKFLHKGKNGASSLYFLHSKMEIANKRLNI